MLFDSFVLNALRFVGTKNQIVIYFRLFVIRCFLKQQNDVSCFVCTCNSVIRTHQSSELSFCLHTHPTLNDTEKQVFKYRHE